MNKTLISSLAGLAIAFSLSANAVEHDHGPIVNAGVNVVVNVGNLVVSFGQTALVRFPKSAVGTAKDLAKCLHDGITGSAGAATTAPILCPVTIGTEAATAMILTGVAGAQAVVAIPSQFAKEVADAMLKQGKKSWEALDQFKHHPGFWVLNLGVCIASQTIGHAAKLGAKVIDLVSAGVGGATELVVAGVRTGITYGAHAVVVVADTAAGRAKIICQDAHGAVKAVWVSLVKVMHGKIGGNDGAIKNFLDNFVGRLVTLPVRVITGQTLDQMVAQAIDQSQSQVELL